MPVRIQLVFTDDLDEAGGTLTDIGPDGETRVISLDGVVRELYLTKAHSGELDAVLAPYLAAGHPPGAQPEMPSLPDREEVRRVRLKGQGKRREIPGTRDFYRDLREWAVGAGIKIPVSGTRPHKQNYRYEDVLPGYLAHLAKTAAAEQDGGVAAARLDMARLLGLFPARNRAASLPGREQPGAAGG